jgi:hypothetical protein
MDICTHLVLVTGLLMRMELIHGQEMAVQVPQLKSTAIIASTQKPPTKFVE